MSGHGRSRPGPQMGHAGPGASFPLPRKPSPPVCTWAGHGGRCLLHALLHRSSFTAAPVTPSQRTVTEEAEGNLTRERRCSSLPRPSLPAGPVGPPQHFSRPLEAPALGFLPTQFPSALCLRSRRHVPAFTAGPGTKVAIPPAPGLSAPPGRSEAARARLCDRREAAQRLCASSLLHKRADS